MRRPEWRIAALFSAALIAGCGGDDKVQFGSVVSFGDSVSDAGSYQVGTIAALGGGKFTVNGPDGLTWTEVLARQVGVPAQCAAQTGMLPNNGVTGAPVQNFANCFNYAQGSSRVSSSGTGPNGVALQTAFGEQNLGFMAISLKAQIENHLAKTGGSFGPIDLVTVNAGGNDIFMQLGAVGSAFGGGAAAVATGTVAGWSNATLDAVARGGQDAVNAASAAAVGAMAQAGAELAGYVKSMIVGKGARYVLVRNLGDPNLTAYGATLDDATKGLVTAMTQAFNTQLEDGLAGTSAVILFDDYDFSQSVVANPASYGFSNITVQSCGPNAFGNPNGASIVCNTGNLIAGDTSRYAFADSVHPTPYAHQVAADVAMQLMRDAGWQ
jgi:phospholipase/lecithinase/hemolysin